MISVCGGAIFETNCLFYHTAYLLLYFYHGEQENIAWTIFCLKK